MQGFHMTLMSLGIMAVAAAAPNPSTSLNSTSPAESSSQENPVMYSYSEAVVGPEGKPEVSQLTIIKAKHGGFEYAKNTNGNFTRGKWDGPLPTTPETKVADILENSTNSFTDDLVDPVKILQESIGSSVQDLIKALNF